MGRESASTRIARVGHHYANRIYPVPTFFARYNSPLDYIARELGIQSQNDLARLFGPTVNLGTMREWRRGNRQMPRWAVERLTAEIKRRREALDRAEQWIDRARQLLER